MKREKRGRKASFFVTGKAGQSYQPYISHISAAEITATEGEILNRACYSFFKNVARWNIGKQKILLAEAGGVFFSITQHKNHKGDGKRMQTHRLISGNDADGNKRRGKAAFKRRNTP